MGIPAEHRVSSRNSSKVRSTLRQFVRDWADEGAAERDRAYTPLIDALQRHLPPSGHKSPGSRKFRILCPGCGLGRLPFELALRGYEAQGNEFSYHMLLGSYLIFGTSPKAYSHTIYPYILNISNRRSRDDNLQKVRVP